mgnify:CR=1 FL=1
MPITAKLSRKLYETFGDEAAGEMIDWMQRVDAQRAELREINELMFARFASLLGERTAELEARAESRFGELQAGLARTDGNLTDLRRDMETGFARLETRIEQRTADIMKWSLVFWVGSVVTLVGALATLARLLP